MGVHARAWTILLVFLGLELIPFSITFALGGLGVAGRLYAFDAAPHWAAWLFAIVVATAYVAYAAHAFPLIRENFLKLSSMKLVAVAFAIVTGTVEELYFRKFVMDWAWQHGLTAAVQVAISAVVFGAAHGVWGVFAKQWRMAIGATIATGLLGLLLALVYLAAGRHVAPCIWAHMLINLAIEPWLILAAASASSDVKRSPMRA